MKGTRKRKGLAAWLGPAGPYGISQSMKPQIYRAIMPLLDQVLCLTNPS